MIVDIRVIGVDGGGSVDGVDGGVVRRCWVSLLLGVVEC